MKSLAATILDQRTEVEQFFLEALQEVCIVYLLSCVSSAVVFLLFNPLSRFLPSSGQGGHPQGAPQEPDGDAQDAEQAAERGRGGRRSTAAVHVAEARYVPATECKRREFALT